MPRTTLPWRAGHAACDTCAEVQDRYAGDVGDFGKLALLRTLLRGLRLGIGWYRTSGEGEAGNDGRHLGYLDQPVRFRDFDPALFDALLHYRAEVSTGRRQRSIGALEGMGLLPKETRFHSSVCPPAPAARADWAREMVTSLEGTNLVFLDPDNGLEGARLTPKSAAVRELVALRSVGRALVLYHHQTRRRGGAAAEFEHVAERLQGAGFPAVEALRLKPYSPRFYFLLDASEVLSRRLAAFASRWGCEVEHFARRC